MNMFPAPVSEQGLEDIMLNIKNRFANTPKVAIAGVGKTGKLSLFHAMYCFFLTDPASESNDRLEG
jgi:hypothetical protein